MAAFGVSPSQSNPIATTGRSANNSSRPSTFEVSGECHPQSRHHTRRCLLSDDGSQRESRFPAPGLEVSTAWRKINIVLPMPAEPDSKYRPRPETEAPFVKIKHVLKVRLVCLINDVETVVVLTTPIRFGTCSDTLGRPRGIPAYVEMFHENGELRLCDPLPLYEAVPGGLLHSSSNGSFRADSPSKFDDEPMDVDRPSSSHSWHSDPA